MTYLYGQYDKEFDLKNTLEGKVNYLLTIAGVVSTLLFGFGTFLIDNLDTIIHFCFILVS